MITLVKAIEFVVQPPCFGFDLLKASLAQHLTERESFLVLFPLVVFFDEVDGGTDAGSDASDVVTSDAGADASSDAATDAATDAGAG